MNRQGTPTGSIDYDELISELKSNIKTRLGDLTSRLLNGAGDTLFELADNAHSNEDQNRYFEMMRLLKDIKPEIANGFMTHIMHLLRPYEEMEAEKSARTREAEGELSLVDDTEVEDMVLIKNMGERAAARYREQLSHLEARLEHLALKTPDIFARDALRPVHICEAFNEAISDYFDVNAKKVLFGIFSEGLLMKLDSVYDSLNNRLIDAGILPQIKLHAGRTTTPRKRPPARGPRESSAPDDQQPYYPDDSYYPQGGQPMPYGPASQGAAPASGGAGPGGPAPGAGGPTGESQPQSIGGYAMTAPPGGGYSGGPQHVPPGQGGAGSAQEGGAGAAQSGPGAAAGTTSGAGGAPAAGSGYSDGAQFAHPPQDYRAGSGEGAEGGIVYRHYTAGIPASQVSRVVGNYIGSPIAPGHAGRETLEDGSANPAFPASTPQYFGHQEILSALSSIQSQHEFIEPETLNFDAEAIKQAVVSAIAKKSGGAVTKRINHIAEKTIDFIELVFEAIIDDKNISDTIKALLLRLQIPVIKASMLDQEFFIYDDHPARVLLDKITEVGVGVTEHTDEVYIRLDRIINTLVNEYELQTSTFQAALDKINEFIEERDAVARAQEEEAQKQVLREHARNAVLGSLRSITAGKTLPEAVHPLVLKRWPTLMFNHYLQHGKENDEWIAIIEVLRDIVESVQPFNSVEDLVHLKAEKDELVERVRYYMERTYKSRKDIDQVIKGLTDTHDEMIAENDFPEPQIEMAQEAVARSGPREKPDVKSLEERREPRPLPSNIMPGMWFEVYIDADTPVRRLKLSVIIVEETKLIFVNHGGELVIEKQIDDFKEDLDAGRSKVIMGHSVFDHALSSVITRLQPH